MTEICTKCGKLIHDADPDECARGALCESCLWVIANRNAGLRAAAAKKEKARKKAKDRVRQQRMVGRRLTWSAEKPRAGWWWRADIKSCVFMALVVEWAHGPREATFFAPHVETRSKYESEWRGLWAGPIEPPDAPDVATPPNDEAQRRGEEKP